MPKNKGSRRSSKNSEYYFDEEAAQNVLDFFPTACSHVKGALKGKPFELMPWMSELVLKPLFGWKRTEDELRKYGTAFIFISRKNSKTLFAAGLGLALTAIDDEPGAEVYCIAATEDQARICFDMARINVEQNAFLKSRFEVLVDCIYHPASGSVFRVLSSTAKGKTGFNPHAVIVDEYHEFEDNELISALTTGMAARRQPLLIYTTTAGKDVNGPCFKEYEKAKKILAGDIVDETYLPVIFEAEPADDPGSVETWKKANPGYGLSVQPRYLEQKWKQVQGWPTDEAKFKQFHLNLWQRGAEEFITAKNWDACGEDYNFDQLLGRPCFGGLDLARIRDMCSFGLVFPFSEDVQRIYRTLVWYWVPEEMVGERHKRGFRYPEWVRRGLVKETQGNCTDYGVIRDDIREIGRLFNIREIGYDPYNANEITTALQNEDGFEMTLVRQGYLTLGPPTKRLEELVLRREFRHNRHDVLTWNVGNAMVIEDGKQNRMISKKKSREQVDGLAAIINALSRAILQPDEVDVFAQRGLYVIESA